MLKRIGTVPFEMCIAALLLFSGLTGLFHLGLTDPIGQLLPHWEAAVLNGSAVVSGMFMAMGIGCNLASLEGFGLWLLNGVILSRFILYGYYFGYGTNFFLTGAFDLTVLVASITRMFSIRNRHIIVSVKEYDS